MKNEPIVLGCKEAVAFEMMRLIDLKATDSASITERINDPKLYYFDLYLECLAAISNEALPRKSK